MPTMMTNVNGEPLSPESLRMLDYLRERAAPSIRWRSTAVCGPR